MTVHCAGRTDIGRCRSRNEDALIIDTERGLFAVCDGMGGHAAGDVAAAIAVETITRSVSQSIEGGAAAPVDMPSVIHHAVASAAQAVHDKAQGDDSLAGMGCTATAIIITDGQVAMAHVGDSRLYLLRDGHAYQLSSDHTMAAQLVAMGTIEAGAERHHRLAHVLTRAIGPQPNVEIDHRVFPINAGDQLVLCSDGLGDYIPSPDWLATEIATTPVEYVPDQLVSFANASGGRDNVTVIAIDIEPNTTARGHHNNLSNDVLCV